jgi:hypothetical protein
MAGEYTSALECMLQSSDAESGAAAAFAYIDAALHGGRSAPKVAAPERAAAFKAAVVAAMGRLVQADSTAAARLILRSFPGDHAEVVDSLRRSPQLQYRYLKGAMQVGVRLVMH